MSKTEQLRMLISERLSAAAIDIFGVVERTIAEYEEEVRYSKKENARLRELLTTVLKPEIRLHRAEPQKFKRSKHEVAPEQQHCEQERSPSPDKKNPEPQQIKKELEDLWASQEGEQLQNVKMQESGSKDSMLAIKCVESLFDQDQTQFSHLDKSGATTSTDQITTEPDDKGPGISEPEWTLSGDKPYNYHVCSRAFSVESSLEYHMMPHSGAKTFNCKICRKRFKLGSLLTAHMRNHTDEKPFKCSVCTKRFKRKDSLDFHMRCHTGENNYFCSFCGKIFYSKGRLKNHLRIHTGEKPFKCSICSKEFNNKSNQKIHMMTHTGERPYSCNVCGKGFKLKSCLKSHMAIHEY